MESVQIQQLTSGDVAAFKDLINLFEDVFEMQSFTRPADEHLTSLLANRDFHVFVAQKENRIVGGLTTYTLHQYYSPKPLAYIYDLAVARPYQRKGIGKQLIYAVTDYFRSRGYEEVFVQADKTDGYALDFYRQTGPTEEEDVSHFYYTLTAT